jgi:hypothetical protein
MRPPPRPVRAIALTCWPGYRTGTRARRKPWSWCDVVGSFVLRNAAWQKEPSLFQLPPRATRTESENNESAHHCHTLPRLCQP